MRHLNPSAFLFLGIFCLLSCKPAAEKSSSAHPPVPVEIAVAEQRDMPVTMKTIGIVEPVASVQIKSKVPGEILEVAFTDGASVRAGEPLFTIDARPFEAALKKAEANLAIAQANAGNASEQAERYSTLIRRGVASKEQTSQFLTTAESLQAEVA
ncbi:MAG: efflux RND transporter periplasmic adaptor subunit, partial [Chthoniobacterales bacterium]